jgi:altronate dehydratase small subunit
VARRAMPAGHHIRKYGAAIGEATEAIAAGAHVHVHNLRSLRARREEKR